MKKQKQKISTTEQQINSVLTYHDKQLSEIEFPDNTVLDSKISVSEELLRSLGITPKTVQTGLKKKDKPVMVVPSWDELVKEAEQIVGTDCAIEDLFTEEELKENSLAVVQLNKDFNTLHKLDAIDITISSLAGLLGGVIDILLVGIPQKTPEGLKGGQLSNYVRDWFDKKFPEEEMQKLANSKVSKVPYDAQDNRNTTVYVETLSAYYHRLLQLGHDPFLGLIFGVNDILHGTMTTIDKKGKIVVQVMECYEERKESDIFAAIAKQIIHFKSDVTTSMGLPAPFMALFNLLQFGKIGEEEQTIAEIVQGMYYEGYDFIHFCSMSIPAMIVEVVVRLCYGIKRIKEGHAMKDSIPFSLNHGKHPKLSTMLFVAHSASVAVNAGKVYFTKNPMSINQAQWMAFGKYSYKQLKWAIMEKPELRDKYVRGVLNEELNQVYDEIDRTFDDFSKDYIVVFNQ